MKTYNTSILIVFVCASLCVLQISSAATKTTASGTFTYQEKSLDYTVLLTSHSIDKRNRFNNVIVFKTEDYDLKKPTLDDFNNGQAVVNIGGDTYSVKTDTVYFYDVFERSIERMNMECPKNSAIDYKQFFSEFNKAK